MHKVNGFTRDIFAEGNDPMLQFFAAFDMMDQSSAVAAPFKAMAISQLEWTRFWSRRVRAMMHAPSELATCRTPQDVANWQRTALQAATEDWSQCTSKITTAWSHAFEQASEANAQTKGGAASKRRVHDYIVLPGASKQTDDGEKPEARARETAA